MRDVVVIVIAIAILCGIGAVMYYSLCWARRSQGRGKIALGHALQELDRHTTRPSVENKLEHEAGTVYVDDERGGE